jgi:DNA-nicking Smr family endonuclease
VKRGGRTLTEEDRILWHRVARTVKPRQGSALPAEPQLDPAVSVQALAAASEPAQPRDESFKPFLPPYVPPVSTPSPDARLDRPTHGKIARGRLSIDARIDLHGMTQAEAHEVLLAFLHRAHASGMRHVLVITGKGISKGGDGILRRAVPGWLTTPPFRGLVGAHATAARHHGGEGALYLRLRRQGRDP